MALRSLPPLKTFQSESFLLICPRFCTQKQEGGKDPQSPYCSTKPRKLPDDNATHAERLHSAKGDGHYLVLFFQQPVHRAWSHFHVTGEEAEGQEIVLVPDHTARS